MAELTLRAISADELVAFSDCVMDVFGVDPAFDPAAQERQRALLPVERAVAVFDGATVVATAAAFTLELAVCGGRAAMGGLTNVTVRPTHRRRGLLRRLMAAHLADVAARGEPLSGLYASEGGIYQRFGYGVAAHSDTLAIAGGDGTIPPGPGDEVRMVDAATAATLAPPVYAAATADRPGTYQRTPAWWTWRLIADRPSGRRGRGPRRWVVCARAGVVTGYAAYRQALGFVDGRADGAIDIDELVAIDPLAEATLWRHLTAIDLCPRIVANDQPVDSALPWLVANPRAVSHRGRADTLWLRLHDVAAALTARRYQADGTLVIAVDDPLAPAPRAWRLEVAGGGATCAATTAAPDLTLALPALGSIYLAGVSPTRLHHAGHVTGSPAAIALATAMFAWPVAPWCPEQF
ncbi:MAG: GNAT family N-acetyltransferase [Kofleriaceae bacterium]